jgi:hypothetical protein
MPRWIVKVLVRIRHIQQLDSLLRSDLDYLSRGGMNHLHAIWL